MANSKTSFRFSRSLGIALTVAASVLLAAALRTWVVGAYAVPSASMEGTLLPGDYLLVNKLAYRLPILQTIPRVGVLAAGGIGRVQRGDVVVFSASKLRDADGKPLPDVLVKRVVGLPGDTVEVQGATLRVNGGSVSLPGRHPGSPEGERDSGSARWTVPGKGEVVSCQEVGWRQWESFLRQEGWPAPSGRDEESAGDLQQIVLERDYYFVVGDNLEQSSDSRSWGPVAASAVIGEAVMIYWSVSPRPASKSGEPSRAVIRWDRIGTFIR